MLLIRLDCISIGGCLPQLLNRLEVSQRHFLAALGSVNPSALRERHVEIPNVRWADIGGLEDVKRELRETGELRVYRQLATHSRG